MRTTELPAVPRVGDEVGQPEPGAWWGAGGGNVKPGLLCARRRGLRTDRLLVLLPAQDTRYYSRTLS